MHTRSRINKEQPISQSVSQSVSEPSDRWVRNPTTAVLSYQNPCNTPIVRGAGDRTWRLASFVSFGNCHHITSVLSHHAAQRWCPARRIASWSAAQFKLCLTTPLQLPLIVRIFIFYFVLILVFYVAENRTNARQLCGMAHQSTAHQSTCADWSGHQAWLIPIVCALI